MVLIALCLVGCRSSDRGPIEPFSMAPYVAELTIAPKTFNTDTINVGAQRLPTDQITLNITLSVRASSPEGLVNVEEVPVKVFKPNSQALTQQSLLLDDGKPPDAIAGDGTYSALIPIKIVRSDIGDFRVEVFARNKTGLSSNSVIGSVTVLRLNNPPSVSDLQAPDTLSLGATPVLFKLAVRASDPDGQSDIFRVFFNSFLPSGSPSSGNPFQMYDDGGANPQSGDTIAGDGIYSLTVQLPPSATRGNYRFEFQATDRSGATSPILSHTIVVR